jgi:hypothetical protein
MLGGIGGIFSWEGKRRQGDQFCHKIVTDAERGCQSSQYGKGQGKGERCIRCAC